MYAKLVGIGYLGKEPEMRYSAAGVAITSFPVATKHTFTNKEGEKIEQTTWWRISTFGKMAETCNQYLHKGSLIAFEGRLMPDPDTGSPKIWTSKDGDARASYEVTANEIKFLNRVDGPSDDPQPDNGW